MLLHSVLYNSAPLLARTVTVHSNLMFYGTAKLNKKRLKTAKKEFLHLGVDLTWQVQGVLYMYLHTFNEIYDLIQS